MNDVADHKRDVLRARARALARRPDAQAAPAASVHVVEFRLAGEAYAIESELVREVYPLRELTPLPCTPAFVLGIINVRGQIVAVIDLRRFFDLPLTALTELNRVVIVESDKLQVAILADAVVGVRSIALADLQRTLATQTGICAEYVRGVTADRLTLLDADRILADERIVVNESVEA